MKRLKVFGYIIGGGIVLAVVVIALALTPAVQTWAVRRAASGQPGVKMDISRVAAGLSAADVSDLRYEQDGMIVTAKGVSAKYSAWDFLKSRKLNADDVSVSEIVVDMRKMTSPAPATPPPTGGATPASAKPTPFDGLLKQLQLAVDVRVGTLNAKGRALLPDDQIVTFDLKGARIETGQSGKLDWTVDFSDSKVGALLRSLRTSGSLSVRITPDRRIDLVEIEGTAAALGPKIPAEQFKLALKAEQPAVGGNENYSASLGIVRNGAVEPLLKTSAAWAAAAREIAGSWEVGIRSEQLAALLAGLGLPEIAANGAGTFTVRPDTAAAVASGSLRARVSQLAKLSPDLAAIGSVEVATGFDGALNDGVARLDKLELKVTAADGREFAHFGLLQKVSLSLKSQSVTLANPGSDAARIAVRSLPLAWAQSVMMPLVIESGDLSLTLAIEGEPDGSRVRVKTIDPVAMRDVTIRDEKKKALIEKTTVTFRPSLDYSAAKVSAQIASLTISTPVGDSAAGHVSLEVTNLKTKPVITFASQLNAKVVAAHKPFLPVDTGPLDVAIASEGRHEGDTVRLTKSSATITRAGGVLLAAHELLQAVDLEIKTQKFTFTNPGAAAVRFRVGEIPLAWAEPFVVKSKLSGTFAGGTFELSLRSVEDLTFASTAPVTLRGISATIDGKPLVQALDLSASLGATLRGSKVAYEVKRFEAKQGETSLATLVAAGEATLGAKFSATAKGSLDADLAALTKQPALAGFATLARGAVSTSFDASLADTTTAKLAITAKDLVAKQNNQPLGTLVANVTATMKSDGSGSIDVPLTLTSGERKSDISIAGTFGKSADKTTLIFDGKIASANLVADDFQALAALAPSSPPAQPAPTARPGTTVVRAPAPRPTAASTVSRNTTRDTQPFWKGVNGKLELDLKRVRYGADAEISAIVGSVTITDSKLALDNLGGRFKETPFKLAAGVAFSAPQSKPYTFDAAIDANGFDVGAFLRAAAPKEEPQIETKVTISGKLRGSGANLEDLGHGTLGTFDVTGTKGVLRAMSKKSGTGKVVAGVATAASVATAALSLLGKAPPPSAVTGGIELVNAMNELSFDQFTARVERPDEASMKITSMEFLSPFMRVRGSGPITRPAGAPGMPITDWPMAIAIEFGSKGNLAALFQAARVLGTATDDKGYTQLRDPLTIRGTPTKPDSSEFWTNVATAAATDGGGALRGGLEGLFRKK